MQDKVLELKSLLPIKEERKFFFLTELESLYQQFDLARHGANLGYELFKLLRAARKYEDASVLLNSITARGHFLDAVELEFYGHEINCLINPSRENISKLAEFLSSKQSRPSWKRSLSRLDEHIKISESNHFMEDVRVAFQKDQPLEKIIWIITQCESLPAELKEQLLKALNYILCWNGIGKVDIFSGRLVFVSGFSYSGSGAISAFLKQHTSISTPFGMSEMAFIQGRKGRQGIGSLRLVKSFEAGKCALAKFFLESIFTLQDIHSPYSLYEHYRMQGKSHRLSRNLEVFSDLFLSSKLHGQPVDKAIGLGLEKLFDIEDDKTILLNNVLMAGNIWPAPYMNRSVFILVERDLRDQYIARKLENSEARDQGIKEFKEMINMSRQRFAATKTSLITQKQENRLLLLRFENFVTKERWRWFLLGFLNLSPEELKIDKEIFDPDVSRRNVGLFHHRLGAEEEAEIRDIGVYNES
jgi:hypothetical protein